MKRKIRARRKPTRLIDRYGPQLRNLIQGYHYWTKQILEENFSVIYSTQNQMLLLKNLHNFSDGSKVGDCVQLQHTAYKEIRRLFPELSVYRIIGTEPFFFPEGSITTS